MSPINVNRLRYCKIGVVNWREFRKSKFVIFENFIVQIGVKMLWIRVHLLMGIVETKVIYTANNCNDNE